jgi:hypothetical protein
MALHQRIVSLDQLRSFEEAKSGVKGIADLRHAVQLAEPATESPMETRLRVLLVEAGLPCPQAQVSRLDEHGGFLGRPDLYYPKHKLALEYDGGKPSRQSGRGQSPAKSTVERRLPPAPIHGRRYLPRAGVSDWAGAVRAIAVPAVSLTLRS